MGSWIRRCRAVLTIPRAESTIKPTSGGERLHFGATYTPHISRSSTLRRSLVFSRASEARRSQTSRRTMSFASIWRHSKSRGSKLREIHFSIVTWTNSLVSTAFIRMSSMTYRTTVTMKVSKGQFRPEACAKRPIILQEISWHDVNLSIYRSFV